MSENNRCERLIILLKMENGDKSIFFENHKTDNWFVGKC